MTTPSPPLQKTILKVFRWGVASVWLFHGLFSKVLHGIPRHQQIVARVVGNDLAAATTFAVGGIEILVGVWVLSGRSPLLCAATQTILLLTMNLLELRFASDLLLAPTAMVCANLGFLALSWVLAFRMKTHGESGHTPADSATQGP